MAFKKRYILAQEAEERVVALWRKEHGAFADAFNTAVDACQTIILDMYDNSSADVVEVVRCKECKHHIDEEPGMVYCDHVIGGWIKEDAYCSDGERREDDAEIH